MMRTSGAAKALAIALLGAGMAWSVPNRTATAAEPASLAQLASSADIVVLAQAADTDYVYRREYPVRGSAFLRVLIPYKLETQTDLLEVYEEGLHEHECYFPNPSVFEEGRRYLLFLRKDPDRHERYRGLPQGCALDVLVDSDNRYAVRIPITGLVLSDPLSGLARPRTFTDAYAHETDETLSPEDRDRWLAEGWLIPAENGYVYTSGVDLSEIRRLMGPSALDRD